MPCLLAVSQVSSPADIASASKLIFPGVGSYGQAMKILESRGYTQPLLDYINVSRSSASSNNRR
jgi:glutamine amidotransferase/cyclase